MKPKTTIGITLTLLLISMLTLTFNIQQVKAEPRTIIVPDEFSSIQEAINNSNDGDTIYVKAGTYYENVFVNKALTLVGEDKSTTIIDAGGPVDEVLPKPLTVVEVTANNVSISGFTIRNSGDDPFLRDSGIYLSYVSGCNIYGNILTNNYYGIALYGSSNNSFSSNTVINNYYGIELYDSSNNILRNNYMAGNEYNFGVSGWQFVNDVDVSNLVDGKSVYYMMNEKDLVINPSTFPDIGYLALVNSTNIIVENLTLTNNGQGLLLADTTNSSITGNDIRNNYHHGIRLDSSSNCSVSGNTATNNYYGIALYSSFNNSLSGNTVTNNREDGIALYSSFNNSLSENTVTNNHCGIELYGSSKNRLSVNTVRSNSHHGIALSSGSSINSLSSNTVINHIYGIELELSSINSLSNNTVTNSYYGIALYGSSDNMIFHNNFISNTRPVYSARSNNTWDNGYPSGGNYWSDHVTVDDFSGISQDEFGSDGIVDEPCIIDANNEDRYPLMNPWKPPTSATINIHPNTLNLRSESKWIKGFIELPEGYDVSNINAYSIMLDGTVTVDEAKIVGNRLIVTFDRAKVLSLILEAMEFPSSFTVITLTIMGRLYDGTLFEGTDTIRVVHK